MVHIYSIDKFGGITSVRFSRDPGLEDIKSAIDAVAENSKINELRLWDLSCVVINPGSAQLRQMADYARTRFLLPSRVAIVASDDLVYGLSRIYEIYREEGLVRHRVFRSEEEARTWLTLNKIKTCPRCLQSFECKHSDIQNCQCRSVDLEQHQLSIIHKKYDGCLCANCLEQLITEDESNGGAEK